MFYKISDLAQAKINSGSLTDLENASYSDVFPDELLRLYETDPGQFFVETQALQEERLCVAFCSDGNYICFESEIKRAIDSVKQEDESYEMVSSVKANADEGLKPPVIRGKTLDMKEGLYFFPLTNISNTLSGEARLFVLKNLETAEETPVYSLKYQICEQFFSVEIRNTNLKSFNQSSFERTFRDFFASLVGEANIIDNRRSGDISLPELPASIALVIGKDETAELKFYYPRSGASQLSNPQAAKILERSIQSLNLCESIQPTSVITKISTLKKQYTVYESGPLSLDAAQECVGEFHTATLDLREKRGLSRNPMPGIKYLGTNEGVSYAKSGLGIFMGASSSTTLSSTVSGASHTVSATTTRNAPGSSSMR